jgi:hypothetical protein
MSGQPTASADYDLAAVASPGQTVVLRAVEPLTQGQAERIKASLCDLRSDVKWVLLDPILEVARITDKKDCEP